MFPSWFVWKIKFYSKNAENTETEKCPTCWNLWLWGHHLNTHNYLVIFPGDGCSWKNLSRPFPGIKVYRQLVLILGFNWITFTELKFPIIVLSKLKAFLCNLQVEDIIYFSYFAKEILLLPGYEGHCVLSDALKLIVLPVSPNELKGKRAPSFLLSTLRTFTGHTDKGSGQP